VETKKGKGVACREVRVSAKVSDGARRGRKGHKEETGSTFEIREGEAKTGSAEKIQQRYRDGPKKSSEKKPGGGGKGGAMGQDRDTA